jgi:hypothetical protein
VIAVEDHLPRELAGKFCRTTLLHDPAKLLPTDQPACFRLVLEHRGGASPRAVSSCTYPYRRLTCLRLRARELPGVRGLEVLEEAAGPEHPSRRAGWANVSGQPYSLQIRSHVWELGDRVPASSSQYSRMLTPNSHAARPTDRPASIVLEHLADIAHHRGEARPSWRRWSAGPGT